MPQGTCTEAELLRVVDGDTVVVRLAGGTRDEKLRLLCLDTEESNAGGGKPVTPWGVQAKQRAEAFLTPGDQLRLEFPGNETLEQCLRRYRGNYGRLLVYLSRGEVDFQEKMISEGYSPYFVKYGYAASDELHARYTHAERLAQQHGLGVWDQQKVNGVELRNYAVLGVWWRLRARAIEAYRRAKPSRPDIFESRLDYEQLLQMASDGDEAIIFTELRQVELARQSNAALIKIASLAQPFTLFIPDVRRPAGAEILSLLQRRYLGSETRPSMSYAYVRGVLSLDNGRPQIVLSSAEQITDEPPG